jgi:hypothetical protein
MHSSAELTEPGTPLSFPLVLADRRAIVTVADAKALLNDLTEGQRNAGYWRVATRMLDVARRETAYLKAATISLQSALLLQGLIENVSAS